MFILLVPQSDIGMSKTTQTFKTSHTIIFYWNHFSLPPPSLPTTAPAREDFSRRRWTTGLASLSVREDQSFFVSALCVHQFQSWFTTGPILLLISFCLSVPCPCWCQWTWRCNRFQRHPPVLLRCTLFSRALFWLVSCFIFLAQHIKRRRNEVCIIDRNLRAA